MARYRRYSGYRLEGRYWTDRDSRGELLFTNRTNKLADGYAEATSLLDVEKRALQF